MVKDVLNLLTNESYWLPTNYTWNDVNFVDGDVGSNRTYILFTLLLLILILLLRYYATKFCLVPLGKVLGIKDYESKRAEDISLLEKAFLSNKKYSYKQIEGWAKQLDWNEEKVKRWLRLRSKQNEPNDFDKFCLHFCGLVWYSFLVPFELCVLWNTSYLWNIQECWINYPNHTKPLGIWLYYMLELAYYWSTTIDHIFDVKRKEFWQILIHHIIGIALLTFTWILRLHRIGFLIFLIHDLVDIPMKAGKIFNYAGYKKTSNVLFIITLIVWVASRLVLFPCSILKSTMRDMENFTRPVYYILNGLLIFVMMMHIYWTNSFVNLLFKVLRSKSFENDVRFSEPDSSD